MQHRRKAQGAGILLRATFSCTESELGMLLYTYKHIHPLCQCRWQMKVIKCYDTTDVLVFLAHNSTD